MDDQPTHKQDDTFYFAAVLGHTAPNLTQPTLHPFPQLKVEATSYVIPSLKPSITSVYSDEEVWSALMYFRSFLLRGSK